MFHFWAATVLTFLKNSLELLKEKAIKMIPKHERTKAQISLGVAERTIYEKEHIFKYKIIFETLQLTFALYFKMFPVALSGLILICNIFEETYLCHLHAYLLACLYEIHLKFLISHIYFHLEDSELLNNTNL